LKIDALALIEGKNILAIFLRQNFWKDSRISFK
jgi:hypothetical protein